MVEEVRSAVSHVHLTAWFLSPDVRDGRGRRPAGGGARPAGRGRPPGGRPACCCGRARRSRCSARRGGPCGRCVTSSRAAGPDPLRAGQARAAASLPPREDRDRRRPGRVRRRDRLDVAGRRPPRLASSHPARAALGWHDAAVRIDGPLVADVAAHFAMRWGAVTGERLAPAAVPDPAADGVAAQFVRTCPEHVYPALAGGSFGVLESYVRALRSAERLIYLESQYLWSPEIVAVLADKLRRPPDDRFRLVIVLPSRPKGGGDDTRGALGELIDGRPGRRPRAGLLPVRPRGGRRRPGLRPRQGGDRRRPVADRRIGQPQRPLAVQRHRGERGDPRPGARPPHPARAVGRAPRAAGRRSRGRPGGRRRPDHAAGRRGAARAPPPRTSADAAA